jgi:hypothetical protein
MKKVFCMLLLTVLPAPSVCAGESLDKLAPGLCPIDSKPIKKDLHVDLRPTSRDACSPLRRFGCIGIRCVKSP